MASKEAQATSLVTEYICLEWSIAHIYERISQLEQFDVFVGNSEGSATITLLTMWYLKQRKQRPWKLNLLFCGHRAHGTNAQYLLHDDNDQRLAVPVPLIHVLGTEDSLFHEGAQLSAMYAASTGIKPVLHHDGTPIPFTNAKSRAVRRSSDCYRVPLLQTDARIHCCSLVAWYRIIHSALDLVVKRLNSYMN